MAKTSTYRQTMRRLLKSPMQKTFTFLGFTLVFIIILLMAAIRPTFNKISELRSEIRVKERVNEQLQTKLNNLNTLQDLYEEREEDLSVIDLYFPSDMDYSLVMASYEKVVATYGYEMMRLSITKPKLLRARKQDYPGMEKVTISMDVIGDRADFKDLLVHLEEMPVVPDMVNVSVDPKGQDDVGGQLEATITMHVYKTI
jgi:Tfp pilus assembly protein PilO